jgi:hypothetical protein
VTAVVDTDEIDRDRAARHVRQGVVDVPCGLVSFGPLIIEHEFE